MRKAVITEERPINTVKIYQDNVLITKSISTKYRSVRINEILPFRVRFTAIGIEGSSPTNIPPIPLQIIGFSNYIL